MTELQRQFMGETGVSFDGIPINGVHLEYITWLEAQIHALRQTAVMPRFFIGQEVKTEHGIGIIVAIEMPHNGLYLQPERAEAVVWYSTERAFKEGIKWVSFTYKLTELSVS